METSLLVEGKSASIQEIIYVLGSVLLILFSYIRLAEAAFVRISSSYLESINRPKSSDYRIDEWLDKPAPVLVAFSLLKYLFLLAFAFCFYLYICQFTFVETFVEALFLSIPSTFLILWLFGELIPKFFSKVDPARAVKSCFILLIPTKKLVDVFRFLLPLSFSRHEKRFPRKETISISDISDVIEHSADEPEEETEKRLIKGVINFSDLEVKEILRSRIDVVAIHIDTPFDNLIKEMLDGGYSRFPVYNDGLDDIKGILYLKDILLFMKEEKNYKWQKHLKPALFVPENLKIMQLLLDFQIKKIHMAIIVDEYGGTSGIVTLEDILEEIVGDISDEHDSEEDEELMRKIGEGEYIIDGKISLIDFSKAADVDPDIFEKFEDEAETVAGIILLVIGNFPKKNQQIKYKNIEFTVLSMAKRRIKNIKVKIYEE